MARQYCVYTVRCMDWTIITTDVVPTCRCRCSRSLPQIEVVVWQKTPSLKPRRSKWRAGENDVICRTHSRVIFHVQSLYKACSWAPERLASGPALPEQQVKQQPAQLDPPGDLIITTQSVPEMQSDIRCWGSGARTYAYGLARVYMDTSNMR